jgi:glycine/D-amino acid oxidase-like deaminating enzyme
VLRVVIVGSGVFGAWSAHHFQAAGAHVFLVDAYGAAHPRASSGDHSRIFRCGYGADEIYSTFASRSLPLWRALNTPDRPVWYPCGVLWLSRPGDTYAAATRQTLGRLNIPIEILTPEQRRERLSHLTVDDGVDAMLEPGGGVLAARRAVRVLVSRLTRHGVSVIRGKVQPPRPGPLAAVRLDNGVEIAGDRFVFACGAWLPHLFPELLAGRIRPTRQTVVYFGVPAASDLFAPAKTPAWVDFQSGIYGLPDIDDRGVKIGIDEHGPPIDPDTDDRIANAEALARARTWLERSVRGMARAPIIEARVCQYENTATGDFLIDRHPGYDNVWIIGGGSGHGFKHGPAVGEEAARLVLSGGDPNPRFALSGRTTDARRSVY